MFVNFPSLRKAVLLVAACAMLTACKTSEERAQEHFENAQELLAGGDVDRAIVEFRNVFKLNPENVEARLELAETYKEIGDFGNAYAQYLRVVERSPDLLAARLELAEMAVIAQEWDEAERHGRAAIKLAPTDDRSKVIELALDYVKAYRDDDPVAATDVAAAAREILKEKPENLILRRVVVDHTQRTGSKEETLAQIEEGLRSHPDEYAFHLGRLRLIADSEDQEAAGRALKEMVERFPEDTELQQALVNWYIQREDMDGAEAYLRELASAPDADESAKLTVVRFILQTRGRDAARAEVDRLIEVDGEKTAFVVLKSTMDFEGGEEDKAISEIEAHIASLEPSADQYKAKVFLARMLEAAGNVLGARAEVEEVLEADPTNVDGLKLRAKWLINEDKPDEAIIDLRAALAQSPRDVEILTSMGQAHERAGERDLAGERYALAVEASLQAPEESLRYARFLMREGRNDAARALLVEALEKSPANLEIIQMLSGVYMAVEDWNETTRLVWRLRAFENERATSLADGIEAELMLRQDRTDDTIAFLQNLTDSENPNAPSAFVALVITKVRAGQVDEAAVLVEEQLKENPNSAELLYLQAGLYLIEDERDKAADIYQDLLERVPGHQGVLRTLYMIMIADGKTEEASTLLDEQIAKAPDPTAALLFKAEALERDRDFEGAIAIYEGLYAKDSSNVLVANNLASLITTHRSDEADLDRAYAIARRLQVSDIPALKDTFGWIEYRRGNYEEALPHLEAASEGLPNHPLVQYHLGMTYKALGQKEKALEVLNKAVELAGEDPLPQFEAAREAIEELSNEG